MTDRSKSEWLTILKNSHSQEAAWGVENTVLGYLAGAVFGFNTYDGEMDAIFAEKAVEVAKAISNRTTFEYIKDLENYQWYLLLCHLPFFAERIEWGTSIRGAWWDSHNGVAFQSCGIFDGEDQLSEDMNFTAESWQAFIDAVIELVEDSRVSATFQQHLPFKPVNTD